MTDPATPLTAAGLTSKHRFSLLFRDEAGDFWRCSCGVQGSDYNSGMDGFLEHISDLLEVLAAQPSPSREGLAAIEAGTHVPAVDDFGNQYLAPAETPE